MHNVNQKHHLHRNFLTGWPGFKLKEEGGGGLHGELEGYSILR